MSDNNLQSFFNEAKARGVELEIWIDHPAENFRRQAGVCLEANADYFVIGPMGAPGRVCIPYHALRWFRVPEDS